MCVCVCVPLTSCCIQLRVLSCCSHWYELMVARLLYTLPLVTSTDYDLVYVAEGALRLFPQERAAIDDVIIAALRNDIMELIKLSRWGQCLSLFPPLHSITSSHIIYGSESTKPHTHSNHPLVLWCSPYELHTVPCSAAGGWWLISQTCSTIVAY